MEGVELALKKRRYPTLADMKAKWPRKERWGSAPSRWWALRRPARLIAQ